MPFPRIQRRRPSREKPCRPTHVKSSRSQSAPIATGSAHTRLPINACEGPTRADSGAGAPRSLSTTRDHLDHLVQALAVGRPALYEDYVAWRCVRLAGRDLPADGLTLILQSLRDALRSVAGRDGRRAHRIPDGGMHADAEVCGADKNTHCRRGAALPPRPSLSCGTAGRKARRGEPSRSSGDRRRYDSGRHLCSGTAAVPA